MKNNGLISIIVPIFNTERFLDKCIKSILSQTYKNFELILVDDGSTDHCPGICDEYAGKDSRIRVTHRVNGGQASARNVGLELAKGEYIGFVDSDDFIAPEMYEKLMRALMNNVVDLAMCNIGLVDENGKKTDKKILRPLKDEIVTASQIQNGWEMSYNKMMTTSPANKIYHASIWSSLRYPEGMLSEDTYIMPNVYHGRKMACIADTMYYYTQRKDSSVGTASEKYTKDTITSYYAVINFYEEHNYAQGFITSRIEALLWALGAYANYCPDSRKSEGNLYYRQTLSKVRNLLRERGFKNVPLNSRLKLILESASPKYAYKLAEVLGRTGRKL